MGDSDDEGPCGPISSFETYLAEGDSLFKQSEYIKALQSYNLALQVQPDEKNGLVARSKCYLKLGDTEMALLDADAALKIKKTFNKGLYRKAEALYSMGNFEYALMYYHRGHKLRPELEEFRLGINKAEEAINNSIGKGAGIKLEAKGDLSSFGIENASKAKKANPVTAMTAAKKKLVLASKKTKVVSDAPSNKTVKKLLGELYADKEYFEKLAKESADNGNPIHELAQGGLNYLESRTEFWRQQKPLYARKAKKKKYNIVKEEPCESQRVLKEMKEIDNTLAKGDALKSIRLAFRLLKSVQGMSGDRLPMKSDVIGNIHSCLGNAYYQMDDFAQALSHHNRDLQISIDNENSEGESRALGNVGRVHAKAGKFEIAIQTWNLKLLFVESDSVERAWLNHEIGRCHLELEDNINAKSCGKKSLAAAECCDNLEWRLNALVLIGQSELNMDSLSKAQKTFSKGLEMAVELKDLSTQAAITEALNEVKKRKDNNDNAATSDKEFLSSSESLSSYADHQNTNEKYDIVSNSSKLTGDNETEIDHSDVESVSKASESQDGETKINDMLQNIFSNVQSENAGLDNEDDDDTMKEEEEYTDVESNPDDEDASQHGDESDNEQVTSDEGVSAETTTSSNDITEDD